MRIELITCSFGLTEIVKLVPSTTIRNESSVSDSIEKTIKYYFNIQIDLQISEYVEGAHHPFWKSLPSNQVFICFF